MLIFISGSDSFLARQAIGKIKEKYLTKNPDGAELIEIDADTANPDWANLQAVPLFATSRLIIIKAVGLLAADEQEKLSYFLERKPSTTVAVVWDAKVLSAKSKLVDALKAAAQTIDVAPLEGTKLRNWLKSRAKTLELELDDSTAEGLIASSGSDLWRLENELVQLGHGGAVNNPKKQRLDEPFAIFRLLRSRNWAGLQKFLIAELEEGKPIELIIGLLASAIRKETDLKQRAQLTDLLMDIDVGVKAGLLDEEAAIALLVAHLPKPDRVRVQWEATWREAF